jgi:small subunit ribosomal protein S1
LGIKQLLEDPMDKLGELRKGKVVTVSVVEVQDGGLEVELSEGVRAYIKRSDLARDRGDQRPERFGVGDKIDAMITNMDKSGRRIGLSIKARETAEEKEAVQQYGSSNSGASLGDILGAALSRVKKPAGSDEVEEAKADAEEAEETEVDAVEAEETKAEAVEAQEPKADAVEAEETKEGSDEEKA